MSERRPARWRNPETGEVWSIPRRFGPPGDNWEQVKDNEKKAGDDGGDT